MAVWVVMEGVLFDGIIYLGTSLWLVGFEVPYRCIHVLWKMQGFG